MTEVVVAQVEDQEAWIELEKGGGEKKGRGGR